MGEVAVALVGDRNDTHVAHRAIPRALELAGSQLGMKVRWDWHPTASISTATVNVFEGYDALWCVPASPYESEAGAIEAIRFARESGRPFLGTCGGCQHAILEYARNVLGLANAQHAEDHPDALLPLIAPLSCSLVEVTGSIRLEPDSAIRKIYGSAEIVEGYHCRFGLNVNLEHLLAGSALRISGRDSQGEARALELVDHPFFLLTQFQPERKALAGTVPPIVSAFLSAAA
jgi:CTP synthase (UTP-ammonia lyase)